MFDEENFSGDAKVCVVRAIGLILQQSQLATLFVIDIGVSS
jgi:hypothetical protein